MKTLRRNKRIQPTSGVGVLNDGLGGVVAVGRGGGFEEGQEERVLGVGEQPRAPGVFFWFYYLLVLNNILF